MTNSPKPAINLILARSENGIIGASGKIPWHLSEDLKKFKELTLHHPIIMGSTTWFSLPKKPLPDRINIVLSKNKINDKCIVFDSVGESLEYCSDYKEIWIIGGSKIYEQYLPLANFVYETVIHKNYSGDAYAPQLNKSWFEIERIDLVSSSGIEYSNVKYERRI